MNISGPAAVAKPEMLFYAPGDLTVTDEGLLELNGKTYMLSLKVYETVKTDVAYVQDKTVSQIQAKDRILEYLKHKPSITNQKAQELCGFNKNQTYYILHQCARTASCSLMA